MAQRSILLIDDNPAILAMVSDLLMDEGYSVATAANGAEGLAWIEQHRPMLILLDLQMPILDGWGFAHALTERGLTLPILVMSAAYDAQRSAEAIGAIGCLPKPFDLNDLLAAIARIRDAV